jgi:drug/metabolite transporter (DMT)-like permease
MLCLASNYVILRHLRTVNHALLNLIFSFWGFSESLIISLWLGVLEFPESGRDILLIIVSAFLSFFAQTCLTLALKYELAGPVSLLRTTEVIFAFVWQLLFLGVIPDIFRYVVNYVYSGEQSMIRAEFGWFCD